MMIRSVEKDHAISDDFIIDNVDRSAIIGISE